MPWRKTISGLTSLIIWGLAVLLGICLLSACINPSIIAVSGLMTLLTPVLILLNIIALIYSLIRAKIAGWVTFIVLLLSLPQIGNLWAFHFINKDSEDTTFSLMTYNVRNFDLYDWSHNDHSREDIFEQLEESRPDVICFQEFYSKPGGAWDNIYRLRTGLGMEHYMFSRELVLEEGRQWGIATFSRYPIVSSGELLQEHKENNRGNRPYRGIYTDLAIGNDTVRVVNIHLASIYLGREDYNTIESLKENQDITIKSSRSIIAKLLRAFRKRGGQVKELTQFLKSEDQPYPVILCGDFNDLPTSYAYNRLSRGMTSAFESTGWGPGATYNGPIPGLRIDHILFTAPLEAYGTEILGLTPSDHLPLLTKIKIPTAL